MLNALWLSVEHGKPGQFKSVTHLNGQETYVYVLQRSVTYTKRFRFYISFLQSSTPVDDVFFSHAKVEAHRLWMCKQALAAVLW